MDSECRHLVFSSSRLEPRYISRPNYCVTRYGHSYSISVPTVTRHSLIRSHRSYSMCQYISSASHTEILPMSSSDYRTSDCRVARDGIVWEWEPASLRLTRKVLKAEAGIGDVPSRVVGRWQTRERRLFGDLLEMRLGL
jgi:hypothetical protein